MKRALSQTVIRQIEDAVNRGNAVEIKVEHKVLVVVEIKRKLVYKEPDSAQSGNGRSQ